MAGELIDCLIFIEDPWWVWFSIYLNTSIFSFSTRNMMLQDAALVVSKTIPPGVLPLASLDGWKQTLSKPRFISSFLPFTCGPPILPTPESNPCGELELPFVISKVCESQSLSDLHGSSWYISEQRSSGIGENPTIFITDRTKSPRVGKTARWSMLPR